MFDDVTCAIFFIAANEFDQILPDDDMTNQLADSIKQFEQISNSPLFRDVPIILILDKSDLLSEKIKEKDIRNNFPQFEVKNLVDKFFTSIIIYLRIHGNNIMRFFSLLG